MTLGRQNVLTLERGLNLVWFRPNGQPSAPIYAGGVYAPSPRFMIPRVPGRFVQLIDTILKGVS